MSNAGFGHGDEIIYNMLENRQMQNGSSGTFGDPRLPMLSEDIKRSIGIEHLAHREFIYDVRVVRVDEYRGCYPWLGE
jgi:hypothetical protein